MAKKILDLLQDMECYLLTIHEVKSLLEKENKMIPLWCEYRKGIEETYGKIDGWITPHDINAMILRYKIDDDSDYNFSWRLWSLPPTDEQTAKNIWRKTHQISTMAGEAYLAKSEEINKVIERLHSYSPSWKDQVRYIY